MSRLFLAALLVLTLSGTLLAGERESRRARAEDYRRLRVWDYHRPQPRVLGIPHTSERPWGGLRWRGLSYHRNPLADYRDYDDGYYGGPRWLEEVEVLHRNRRGEPVVWRQVWRRAK